MFNACSQRPLRTRYCEAFARRALDPVRHKKRKRTLWEDFCAKPVVSFVGVCVKLTKRFTHNPSPFASAPRGRF